MKKELMQQYLQAKNDVSKYIDNFQKCQNIIDEFNTYLNNLKERYDQYREAVMMADYYEQCYNKYKESSNYDNLSISEQMEINSLLRELKEAENVAKNATKDESSVYCAGPFNVGWRHHEVPDYNARRLAEAKAESIKCKLKAYGDVSQLQTDNTLNTFYYKSKTEYRNKILIFLSSKEKLIAEFRDKFDKVCQVYALRKTLEQEKSRMEQILTSLYESNNKFEQINIPDTNLPQVDKKLLNVLKENFNIPESYIKALDDNDYVVGSSSLIQQMIKDNFTKSVLPQLDYKTIIRPDTIFFVDYYGEIRFQYANGKKVKLESDVLNTDDDMKVVSPFNEKGYAVIKKKYFVDNYSKDWKFVAVDLLGNIYDINNKYDKVEVSCEIDAIMDLLYDRLLLQYINDKYFANKKFAQCVEYLLIRKYLYSRGLLDVSKKYLTTEDKQAIKDIKNKVHEKIKQSKTKTQENTY